MFIRNASCIYIILCLKTLLHQLTAIEVLFIMIQVRFGGYQYLFLEVRSKIDTF